MKNQTIAVLGLWHLGSVTAACLAEHFSSVIGFDYCKHTIDKLNHGIPPILETDLQQLIHKGLSLGRLKFTTNLDDLQKADFFWITIDTKLDDLDQCELEDLYKLFRQLANKDISHKYIISSQIPVGTCEKLLQLIPQKRKPKIAYIPENLQLGKSITGFQNPDMLVIGSDDQDYLQTLIQLTSSIYKQPTSCSLRTAEFSKHAINCFLATSISFSNELAELAVAMEADAYKITEIMRKDKRIGKKLPLFPGPWFSGGTLARDLRSVQAISKKVNRSSKIFDAVISINEHRIAYFIERLAKYIELTQAKIAILGLVYTEGTDTLRRSPGIQLAKKLIEKGALINAFEPMISHAQLCSEPINLFSSALAAATDTDIVIFLRAGCAKDLELSKLAQVMQGNILFDLWDLYDKDIVKEVGLNYIKLGINDEKI